MLAAITIGLLAYGLLEKRPVGSVGASPVERPAHAIERFSEERVEPLGDASSSATPLDGRTSGADGSSKEPELPAQIEAALAKTGETPADYRDQQDAFRELRTTADASFAHRAHQHLVNTIASDGAESYFAKQVLPYVAADASDAAQRQRDELIELLSRLNEDLIDRYVSARRDYGLDSPGAGTFRDGAARARREIEMWQRLDGEYGSKIDASEAELQRLVGPPRGAGSFLPKPSARADEGAERKE